MIVTSAASRLVAATHSFAFEVRILDDNGQHGVFRKTVDAATRGAAWIKLTKDLKSMKVLESVYQITSTP
jgi:hypothetical protein